MDPQLVRFLDLLDRADAETTNTSVRLPVSLRDAAVIATALGLAGSTTELTVEGLRHALERIAQRAVLEAHYQQYPDARPSLAEIALAAAELNGDPLAHQPDLIRRAAAEVAALKRDADAEDVLLYAAGLAAAA